MKGVFRAAAVALTSLAIALSGATAASASKTSGIQEMGFFDRYLVDRINYARVEQNLEPLVFHDPLRGTALGWSRDMAARNFFDHGNTEAHAAPSGCTYVGEAIGYTKKSAYNNPVSEHPDPQRQFDRYHQSARTGRSSCAQT